ncbi:AAA family ATPase [Pseudarthrobacter sp. HLT3-5]|uniref:AAA family ATPase n=1 Tax=Pseudarthrobacter cellobiosi TaxID=2953654 RepID=UPI00208ECBF9|nr:AAA family ATPase [Pseudarthrobacter sp. HLT3-5]MCO4276047.1 AAA family ATPase [Pseudarthrobacter sp. HLT3-5]
MTPRARNDTSRKTRASCHRQSLGEVIAGSIYSEVLTYSQGLLPWQQDALRRHAGSISLSDADLDELTEIAFIAALSQSLGLDDDDHGIDPPAPDPLTQAHIPSSSSDSPAVTLKKVTHLQGVNRMRANTDLTLSSTGLNIVFGLNGVGKSGYTRILKSSCHTRHPESILGNVFLSDNVEPRATIEYLLGDQEKSHEWNLGKPCGDPHLSRVAVYDSKSAQNHVSSRGTTLTVTPDGLEMLQSLIATYDAVALQARMRQAAVQGTASPGIYREATDAQVRTALGTLGKFGGYGIIEVMGSLDETEESELQSLPVNISDRKTNSQATRQAQAQTKQNMTATQARRIETLAEKVTAEQIVQLCVIWKRLRATRIEEAEQTQHDFSQEAVPGVLSRHWHEMWNAAKTYADQVGFTNDQFPSEDMSNCPLCHQPLTAEAHARLRRFNKAMELDLAAERRRLTGLGSQLVDGIRNAAADDQIDDHLLTVLAEENGDVLTQLRADVLTVRSFLDNLPADTDTAESIDTLVAPFIHGSEVAEGDGGSVEGFTIGDSLTGGVTFIDKMAKTFEADVEKIRAESGDGSDVADMEAKLLHLQDRAKVAKALPELKKLHNRLIHIESWQTVIGQCATSGPSVFSGKVCFDYVQQVAAEFKDNLMILEDRPRGGSSEPALQVELVASKVSKGTSNIAFTINGAAKAKTPAEGVLSEGELRAVSIAAFLSDVSSSGDGSAIIFDDPMNSLDQAFQIKVAQRLVKEARTRQVIVFTHSMAFVGALWHEGVKKDLSAQIKEGIPSPIEVKSAFIEITQRAATGTGQQVAGTGTPKGGYTPLYALLEKELYPAAKALFEAVDDSGYQRACENFANNLRKAWEYAVEEIVINGVVARNKPSISTMKLGGLLALTAEDVTTINEGMEVNNFYVHSTGEGNEKRLPEPPELLERLKDISAFVKGYKSRRTAALAQF